MSTKLIKIMFYEPTILSYYHISMYSSCESDSPNFRYFTIVYDTNIKPFTSTNCHNIVKKRKLILIYSNNFIWG